MSEVELLMLLYKLVCLEGGDWGTKTVSGDVEAFLCTITEFQEIQQ